MGPALLQGAPLGLSSPVLLGSPAAQLLSGVSPALRSQRRGSWHLLCAGRPGAGSGDWRLPRDSPAWDSPRHAPPGAGNPDRPGGPWGAGCGPARVASALQVGGSAGRGTALLAPHPGQSSAGAERPRGPRAGAGGVGGSVGLRAAGQPQGPRPTLWGGGGGQARTAT